VRRDDESSAPATRAAARPSVQLHLRQHALEGQSADRRLTPRDDEAAGRRSEHGEPDFRRRARGLHRDDRRHRRGERFGRRADEPFARHVRFARRQAQQLTLRGPGEHDWRRAEHRQHVGEHREPFVALPLAAAETVRDDADGAADCARPIVGPVQPRVKAVHGARLLDVQRFARGNLAGTSGVDDEDPRDAVRARERVGHGSAELSRPDDADRAHGPRSILVDQSGKPA
jgi:hypothetical protein